MAQDYSFFEIKYDKYRWKQIKNLGEKSLCIMMTDKKQKEERQINVFNES